MSRAKKNLLITGGSGLVGGNAAALAKDRWNAVATYWGNPFSMQGVETVALDLENGNAIRNLIRTARPHAVIHCAAWSNLDSCETDPEKTFRINAEAVGILAESCGEFHSRLIFTSTDMVFDGEKGNYVETDPVRPLSVYGESKCRAEKWIFDIGGDFVIARVALVYGRPVTGGTSFSEKLLDAWQAGRTVSLYTDQVRTPIAVQNLAEALLELAESPYVGILHLGGANRIDRCSLGRYLAERKGVSHDRILPVLMSEHPTPAKRPRDASLDTSRAKSVLRTRLWSYQEGMDRTYASVP